MVDKTVWKSNLEIGDAVGKEKGVREKQGSPGRWAHLCARTDPTALTCHFSGKGGERLHLCSEISSWFVQLPWTEKPEVQTHCWCSHLNERLQRVRWLLVSGLFPRAARSCLVSDQMVCLNFSSFRLHGNQYYNPHSLLREGPISGPQHPGIFWDTRWKKMALLRNPESKEKPSTGTGVCGH